MTNFLTTRLRVSGTFDAARKIDSGISILDAGVAMQNSECPRIFLAGNFSASFFLSGLLAALEMFYLLRLTFHLNTWSKQAFKKSESTFSIFSISFFIPTHVCGLQKP